MPEEFQIRTRCVAVEVALKNSTVHKGRLFLHEVARHHEGPETVEDVLNSAEMFFPLAVRDGGDRTVLINKNQILFVRVPVDPGRAIRAEEQSATAWAVQVVLEMVQGASLQGIIYLAQPPGRDRTLDGLNESAPFLCVVGETSFCYARTSNVVLVRERGPQFASVPPPAPTSTRL